ncbi:MAG: thioredoxin family protein [Methanobacteriota archaeon]
MKPKKAITILALVAVVLFVYYSMDAAPLISDEKYTYIAGMRWYKNYEEGQKAAAGHGKPVLIYFWTLQCKYCITLHEKVYPGQQVSKILKEDFVLVAIDLDENKMDARRFGVQYPPYLIFLNSKGEIITRIPGFAFKEQLLLMLEQIKEGKI